MAGNAQAISSNKTYQYGEDFQQKIVALLVRDSKFLISYFDVLSPSFFDFDYLSTISRLVLDYGSKYHASPSKEVLESMVYDYSVKNGYSNEYFEKLVNNLHDIYETDLSDSDGIKEQVRKFGRRQVLIQSIEDCIQSLKGDEDLDKAYGVLEKARHVGSLAEDEGLDFFELAPTLGAMLRSEDSPYTHRIPTLIPALDKAMRGGIGSGEVAYVIGGSGQGKSMVMTHLGYVASEHENQNVYHFTLELSKTDVALRYAARFSGISMDNILTHEAEFVNRMQKYQSYDKFVHIQYFKPGCITVGHLGSYISRRVAVSGKNPGLIIIDYADLLIPVKFTGNTYVDAGNITNDLISLASDLECPVVTGSQVGRGSWYSGDVGANNVSDSWLKVTRTPISIVINQTREQRAMGRINLLLDKCTRGESGVLAACTIDYSRCYISQVDLDAPQNA